MSKQWIAVCIFVAALCGAPFVAAALWRRGVSRPLGYLAGFTLLIVAALWVRHAGGFPGRKAAL